MVCKVYEEELPTGGEVTGISCDSAAQDPEDLDLDYEHSKEHLREAWLMLLLQAAVWCTATIVVQALKKPE
jgi:hypothetical protein